MTCTACGQGLPQGALFCPYCGAAAPIPAPAQGGTAAGRAANAPCEAAPPSARRGHRRPRAGRSARGAPEAPAPLTHRAPAPPAHSAQAEEENGPGQAAQAQNGACEGRRTARSRHARAGLFLVPCAVLHPGGGACAHGGLGLQRARVRRKAPPFARGAVPCGHCAGRCAACAGAGRRVAGNGRSARATHGVTAPACPQKEPPRRPYGRPGRF